jgi:hypothetical protein
MKKTEEILIVEQYTGFQLNELHAAILDWLALTRILTTPTLFQLNKKEKETFILETLVEQIKEVKENEDFWWLLEAPDAKFQIHIKNKSMFCSSFLTKKIFEKYEILIKDYLVPRLEKHGIFGFLRSFDEYQFNNISNLKLRTFDTLKEQQALPKIYDVDRNVAIDCNQLAGFDLYFEGLCFTSCWQMYFSKYYYRYIPKAVFEAVQQVYQITPYQNGLLGITLFKNPWHWDADVNLKYQRIFRDQIGFDQLAWENGVGLLREPYIEFAFEKSRVHTVSYLDNYGQPAPKRKSSIFITRMYDFTKGLYAEHRLKGKLNAQAFFPWIDESSKKMMNYCILNPEYALDMGVTAFEFYIREFLELELENDLNYQRYLPTLRFYIPHVEMFKAPLKILNQKMIDVEFKEIKSKAKYPTFDLKKGKNYLRIIFMDYSKFMKSRKFSTYPKK